MFYNNTHVSYKTRNMFYFKTPVFRMKRITRLYRDMSNKWVWSVFIPETCLPIFYLQCRPYVFSLAYSHFYVGSMHDDIRLHVAWSYTSSAGSPFYLMSSFTLSNHLLLCLPLFLIPCALLPSPSFQRSVPLFSSHVHITSTFFPVLSLWSPPHYRCPSRSFISDLVYVALT